MDEQGAAFMVHLPMLPAECIDAMQQVQWNFDAAEALEPDGFKAWRADAMQQCALSGALQLPGLVRLLILTPTNIGARKRGALVNCVLGFLTSEKLISSAASIGDLCVRTSDVDIFGVALWQITAAELQTNDTEDEDIYSSQADARPLAAHAY